MTEIREFRPNEVALYRQIRREALQTDPHAFGSTVEDFDRQTEAFHARRLANNYESPDIAMLYALDGDRPVGMMGIVRDAHPKRNHTATIIAAYVSPSHRGRGIGGQLLDKIIDRARTMDKVEQLYLSVVSDNHPAIGLYKSRGFIRYGHVPRAYKWKGLYFNDDMMVLYF